jgi:predicted acyl esterase
MGWGPRLSAGTVALALALVGAAAPAEAFDAHGSARQVYVTGLQPGAQTTLLDSAGKTVATKAADAQGGLLFRNVKPGDGYRVKDSPGGQPSDPLTVLSNAAAPPSTDIYNQSIPNSGYGYLTTRDGTKLAINVHPPQDVAQALPTGLQPPPLPIDKPTPTLIEYSGYGYANPAGPTNGIAAIANIMGFTVVDVNMRGTGCSAGAFDFFEPLQNLDGYDVIETIARQPWVANHKVGMMGISYGGISQLFTAQLKPPSLAAISPLSVLDATQTTLYPGGVLNTGFAVAWAKERQHEALPAGPDGGQEWAYKRIQEGDATCAANQALHGQAADLLGKIRVNNHYKPKIVDPLTPLKFVDKINVPVFLACQWEDEQTGGHCPTLVRRFTGTTKKWFTFTNGTHVDSLDPETLNRWYDFLQLYVAKQAPITNSAQVRAAAPVIYQAAVGINGITLPNDPIQNEPTYDGALAAFEQLAPVRILFDNGAGGSSPGEPYPGFEQSFGALPIPGTKARSWYLGTGGSLRAKKATRRARADRFTWNAKARPLTNFSGDTAAGQDGLWTATPPYKWVPPPAGSAASYVSAPLKADTTVVGAGSVQAWIRSSKPNVDLQATITEVRPDGKETFVQNGWLRGNERKLARGSTLLEPSLTLRARDVKPLPRKRFVKVVIPLYYQGHAYRTDSRIRVTITAPNGDQPIWSFSETQPKRGAATVSVGHSKRMASRLVLPVVPAGAAPTALPPCPGLRGEPCRDYTPYVNQPVRLRRR